MNDNTALPIFNDVDWDFDTQPRSHPEYRVMPVPEDTTRRQVNFCVHARHHKRKRPCTCTNHQIDPAPLSPMQMALIRTQFTDVQDGTNKALIRGHEIKFKLEENQYVMHYISYRTAGEDPQNAYWLVLNDIEAL